LKRREKGVSQEGVLSCPFKIVVAEGREGRELEGEERTIACCCLKGEVELQNFGKPRADKENTATEDVRGGGLSDFRRVRRRM